MNTPAGPPPALRRELTAAIVERLSDLLAAAVVRDVRERLAAGDGQATREARCGKGTA